MNKDKHRINIKMEEHRLMKSVNSAQRLISLKKAAAIFGYASDYLGFLIREGKIVGKRVYAHKEWKVSLAALLDHKGKKEGGARVKNDLKKIFNNFKNKKYVTLKEAAEVSGYHFDYIGYLIRKGRVPGKKTYCGPTWLTTEESIRNYLREKKQHRLMKSENSAQRFISLKKAAAIFGYASDYLGFLIREGKIAGKRVYTHKEWKVSLAALLGYKEKESKKSDKETKNGLRKILNNFKNKKYVTLKEAAEVSGYHFDYIGYLIREGKVPGRKTYCGATWLTTKESVRNYLREKEERQNQFLIKPSSVLLQKGFYFYFKIPKKVVLLAILGVMFFGGFNFWATASKNQFQTIGILPIKVEGDWKNVQNVQGLPDVGESEDINYFTNENSATYQSGPLSILIQDFQETRIILPPSFKKEQVTTTSDELNKDINATTSATGPQETGEGENQIFNEPLNPPPYFEGGQTSNTQQQTTGGEEQILMPQNGGGQTPASDGTGQAKTSTEGIFEAKTSTEATSTPETSEKPEVISFLGTAGNIFLELVKRTGQFFEAQIAKAQQVPTFEELTREKQLISAKIKLSFAVGERKPDLQISPEDNATSSENGTPTGFWQGVKTFLGSLVNRFGSIAKAQESESINQTTSDTFLGAAVEEFKTTTQDIITQQELYNTQQTTSSEELTTSEPVITETTTTEIISTSSEPATTTIDTEEVTNVSIETTTTLETSDEEWPTTSTEELLLNPDAKIIIWWSVDGENWQVLDTISSNNLSNALNGGYFTYNAPFLEDWNDIKNLKLKFEGVVGGKTVVTGYLDSVWVKADYRDKTEEEKGSFELVPTKRDWRAEEEPTFELIRNRKQGVGEKALAALGIVLGAENSSQIEIETEPKIEMELFIPYKDGSKKKFRSEEVIRDTVREKNKERKIITIPRDSFAKAGQYSFVVSVEQDGIVYDFGRDFTWGLLGINVNKSIYLPGEMAYLQMAALDEGGHGICNASLTLEIIAPDGTKTILTTQPFDATQGEPVIMGATNTEQQTTRTEVTSTEETIINEAATTMENISTSGQETVTTSEEVTTTIVNEAMTTTTQAEMPVTTTQTSTSTIESVSTSSEPIKYNEDESQTENGEQTTTGFWEKAKKVFGISVVKAQDATPVTDGGEQLFVEKGEISKSSECGPSSITYLPDYFANYKVKGPGIYKLKLTTDNSGVVHEITDQFEVRESVPFDVERIGPTRIYPPSGYEIRFNIKVNQDFVGQVVERVPQGFDIPAEGAAHIMTPQEGESYGWDIAWDVDWKAGESYQLSYRFNAPNISPYLYLLGPLRFEGEKASQNQEGLIEKIKNSARELFGLGEKNQENLIFSEIRQWQITADSPGNRSKTVTFFIGTYASNGSSGKSFNATNTLPDGSNFTFKLAENTVQVKDAFVDWTAHFNDIGTTNYNATSLSMAFDACQDSCTPNAWNGTGIATTSYSPQYLSNSGESDVANFKMEVTGETQLAGYAGGNVLMRGQFGYCFSTTTGYCAGTAIANKISYVTGVLYLTYTYDDGSPSITNTVIYPLESTTTGDYGSRKSSQTTNCALGSCPKFNYNMELPELTNGNQISSWFALNGMMDSAGTSDYVTSARIGSAATTTQHVFDEALNSNDFGLQFLFASSSLTGYQENTIQTLERSGTNATSFTLGGEVWETYAASTSAATSSRTIRIPLGEICRTSVTTTCATSVSVSFPETGVVIKKAWTRIAYSATSTAATNLTIATKVGSGATTSNTYSVGAIALPVSHLDYIYDVVTSSDYATLAAATPASPVTVTVSTQWATARGATGGELLITYTYNSEATGYNNTQVLFAGNSTGTNFRAAWASNSGLIDPVLPEATSSKTILRAGLLASFFGFDNDGTVPGQHGGTVNTMMSIGANLTTGACTAVTSSIPRTHTKNNSILFYRDITSVVTTSDSQTYTSCFVDRMYNSDTSAGYQVSGALVMTYQVSIAAGEGITVGGTVYTNEGTATSASGSIVSLVTDGVWKASTTASTSTGAYSFSNVTNTTNTITVYLDNSAEKGVVVTIASSSDILDLNIYRNRIIVRHENAGPITITNLDKYDSDQDGDILFTASTTPKTLTASSSSELFVWSGDTFLTSTGTAGTISLNSIDIRGTLTATSNQSISVSGDWDSTSTAVFNAASSTVMLYDTGNFGGTATFTFYNLTFGDGTAGTTTAVTSATATISNRLTIAANQTLNAGSKVWNIAGYSTTSSPFVVAGSFSAASSTFRYTTNQNTKITATTYYNLELVDPPPQSEGEEIAEAKEAEPENIILQSFFQPFTGYDLTQSDVSLNKLIEKYQQSAEIKSRYQIGQTKLTIPAKDKNDISLEIGEEGSNDFTPTLKLDKWQGETSFKMKPDLEGLSAKDLTLTFEGNKIKFASPKKEFHFYDLPQSQEHPEGAYEYEVILKEKPATNTLTFDIETSNLDFFYQPALNQQNHPNADYCTETECFKDGKVVTQRPENVVGSYAVYYKDGVSGDYSQLGGKNYGTGKAFHIYRPKITDALGNWTWEDLKIDTVQGKMIITIPQEFLENAAYPLVNDPTLGYTTSGASSDSAGATYAHGCTKSTSTENGTVSKVTIRAQASGYDGTRRLKMGYYTDSSNYPGSRVAHDDTGIAPSSTLQWYDSNAISGSITSSNAYWLALLWTEGSYTFTYRHDTGSLIYYQSSYTSLPATYPASAPSMDEKVSIYLTYTATGGGPSAGPVYTLATTTGQNLVVNNNLLIGNGVDPITVTATTNNPIIDVGGNVTISASSTLVAPTSSLFSVAGNWSKTGSFTHSTGTVAFDGSGTSTFSGTTTFYNLTSTSSSKVLQFATGTAATTTVSGTLTLNGQSCGTPIYLRSTASGTQFYINAAAGSINYVDVKDSYAITALTANSSVNSNNNTNWTINPCAAGVTISGYVYTDDGNTTSASGSIVSLVVNGTWKASTTASTSTGGYSFSNVTGTTSTVVTAYLDNSSEKGVAVTIASSSNITDLNIYRRRIIVRHETTGPITIQNLDKYDSTNDGDILFTASSTAATLDASSSSELFVWSGDTFLTSTGTAGTISLDSLDIRGTFTATGSQAINLTCYATFTQASCWYESGTFNSASSTVTFTTTSTGKSITTGGSPFWNLVFNGSGGGWSFQDAATTTNDLTITAGTVSSPYNMYVYGGDATSSSTGVLSWTGGTFLLGGGGYFRNNSTWTFYNLTFGSGSATTTYATGTGTTTISNILTIAASQTLNAGSKTWNIAGYSTTSSPFVVSGSFTAASSTFRYTTNQNTKITATIYYNLELVDPPVTEPTEAEPENFIFEQLFKPFSGYDLTQNDVSLNKLIEKYQQSAEIKSRYQVGQTKLVMPAKDKNSIRLEIGEEGSNDFTPTLKLDKWQGETSFKIKPDLEGITPKDLTLTFEGNKIKFASQKKEFYFYDLPQSQENPEGAYEYEVILKEKPATNTLTFDIETFNLDFFYQPPLNQQKHFNVDYCTETECFKDGKVVIKVSENVIGSYAVYYKDGVSGDYSQMGGKNYGTGKAFHIYRPKITDALGNWVWEDLKIDTEKGKMTITIPQDFLDNAIYPLINDPTLGYTSIGSLQDFCAANYVCAGLRTQATSTGTSTKITTYASSTGSMYVQMGYYTDSSNYPGTLVASSTTNVTNTTPNWIDSNTISGVITSGNYYWLAQLVTTTEEIFYYRYDAGSTIYYQSSYTSLPATYPGGAGSTDQRVSMYLTYTTTGAPSVGPTYTLATTTSQTLVVNNNLLIGNGVDPITVTATTNNPIIDVGGNVTISASSTLVAPTSSLFSVAGNWSKTGSFTHSTGTVAFDGSGTSTFSGTTTFYNLTSTSSSKVLQFATGTLATTTVSGTLTLNGQACGTPIYLRSTASGTQFYINAAAASISYVDVKDSYAVTALTANNSVNSGNNSNWTINPCVANITIAGYVYTDEGNTTSASGSIVSLAVNGSWVASTTASTTNGSYSFSVTSTTSTITVYLDNSGEKGVAVTIASSSDITDLNIYKNRIIVRHENTGPITIANLDKYDSDQDGDILFTASTTAKTLNASSSSELFVWSGDTFLTSTGTAGTISLSDLDIRGTFTATGSQAINLTCYATFTQASCWYESGTFNSASSTVTFTTTSTGKSITTGGSPFWNLVFNGSGGGWNFQDAATTTNDLTVTLGTVSSAYNMYVYGGDATSSSTGVLNWTGGTFLLDGTGNFGGSSTWTFYNLTFGNGAGNETTTATSTGTTNILGTLTISSAHALNAGQRTWILRSGGTPFQPNGNFTSASSTFKYSAVADVTASAKNYYNLEVGPAAGPGWSLATNTAAANIYGLAVDSGNNVVYAGDGSGNIYRCDTLTGCGPSNWTLATDTTTTVIYSLTYDSYNRVIYAGAGNGPPGNIYRCDTSTGCGPSNWTLVTSTPKTHVFSLTYDSYNKVVYAGAYGSVSNDAVIYRCNASTTPACGSSDWTIATTTPDVGIVSFAYDSNKKVIYAGTYNNGSVAHIYRCDASTTSCGPSNWTLSKTEGSESYIYSLTYDSYNRVVYAGTANFEGIVYRCDASTTSCGSSDWTTATDTFRNVITFLGYDSNDKVVYFGLDQNAQIYRCNASTTPACGSSDWSLATDTNEDQINGFTYDSYNRTVYVGGSTSSRADIYRYHATTTDTLGTASGQTLSADGYCSVNNANIRGDTYNTTLDFNGNLTIGSQATFTAPTSSSFTIAGNWSNSGSFNHSSSTVVFDASATGKTIDSFGTSTGKSFYNIDFNNTNGGWTVQNYNLLAENNLLLTNVSTTNGFIASSGRTIEVRGNLTNSISGGGTTTWTGSTLYLNKTGGGNYSINTKTAGNDVYGTLQIGANTEIRMWNSYTATATVSSNGSLYSMDHDQSGDGSGDDGKLFVWGDYHTGDATTTDYCSYNTDFDGTSISPRQCLATINSGASWTVDAGKTLYVVGWGAASSDISVMGQGTSALWNFINNGTSTIQESTWNYPQFSSGTVTVINTTLNNEAVASTGILNADWYLGVQVVDRDVATHTIDTNATDITISENSTSSSSTVWKWSSGSWGTASTSQQTGSTASGTIPYPGQDGAIRIREYKKTSATTSYYKYNLAITSQAGFLPYNYYNDQGSNYLTSTSSPATLNVDKVIWEGWQRNSTSTMNPTSTVNDPPTNGSWYIGMNSDLEFSVSSSTVNLGNLNLANSLTATGSTILYATTSYAGGYLIKAYASDDGQLRLGTTSNYIIRWSSSNATPTSWTGNCYQNGQCGFGYTTSDNKLSGGTNNRFATSTNYAGFATSSPGDMVGDSTTTASGATTTVTYRVSVSDTQLPGTYTGSVYYICTVNY